MLDYAIDGKLLIPLIFTSSEEFFELLDREDEGTVIVKHVPRKRRKR